MPANNLLLRASYDKVHAHNCSDGGLGPAVMRCRRGVWPQNRDVRRPMKVRALCEEDLASLPGAVPSSELKRCATA